MRKSLLTAITILAAVATSNAQANDNYEQQTTPQVQGQQQTRVAPTYQPPYQPPVQTPRKFYFGMNVELVRGYYGTTLRVVSVTPGSPAYQAGLEFGDEIRTVNGQGFDYARDSFEAVAMLNQYVGGGGGAPAVAAARTQATYVSPLPSPRPMARMIVRNVRNGQNVGVNVFPTQNTWSGPAPAAPAQAAPPTAVTNWQQR